MFHHHQKFPSLCNVISKLNHIKQKYGTTLSYINIQYMIVLLSSHPDMLGRAVRILLFLSWIYKRSVMPVFNNKRSFAFLICSYAVELYFLCRKKRMGKRSYLPSLIILYFTSCRQPGVVKLPQVPKSRKPISENLITIEKKEKHLTRHEYN